MKHWGSIARLVANIMQQRAQAEVLFCVLIERDLIARNGDDLGHDCQNAQAVRKAGVGCIRIREVSKAELLELTKPLKARGVDHPTLDFGEFDRAVN